MNRRVRSGLRSDTVPSLMPELADSVLLRDALGARSSDQHAEPRARLRASYLAFKERSSHLAGEIASNLPLFTVHDRSHLDALWEMADLAAGTAVELNAIEAYVLGGAILVHDLGLAVAAFPDPSALRAQPLWTDTLAALLARQLGRGPSQQELEAAPDAVRVQADESVLRQLHALQAERLVLVPWKDDRGDQQFLIEDSELRRVVGSMIGLIAQSHWWPADQLATRLDRVVGAPPWCPAAWTIDQLKLACLLRVADALHLDARRAPTFLRTIRRPHGVAALHWDFQERLNRPFKKKNRVVFTSTDRFGVGQAQSWWLCYETLRDVDKWLREVDVLLSDLNRTRLDVRGVMAAEDPLRFARLVETADWTPVDTQIRISDVGALVAKLGGEELYGRAYDVALRELIQNAADAVRARRLLEPRPNGWGLITVTAGSSEAGQYLEVRDVGVGMSREVLVDGLLDFGTSFWSSAKVTTEFPGLLAAGFSSIGTYGIGFFSVFMLGSRVTVTTRPLRSSSAETMVLDFPGGIGERPVLRSAGPHELLFESGTVVRVWLHAPLDAPDGLLHTSRRRREGGLGELCEYLCPAMDVDVIIEQAYKKPCAIRGDSWRTDDPVRLVSRVRGVNVATFAPSTIPFINNMTSVYSNDGELVGRLAVHPSKFSSRADAENPGVVAVGGLRASTLTNIAGVVVGTSRTAARDVATPVLGGQPLADWASDQAVRLGETSLPPLTQVDCAATIYLCGGDTKTLSVAESAAGWLSADAVIAWAASRREVHIVWDRALSTERDREEVLELSKDVLSVDTGVSAVLQSGRDDRRAFDWPPLTGDDDSNDGIRLRSLSRLARSLIASAWCVDPADLPSITDDFVSVPLSPVVLGRRNGHVVHCPGATLRRLSSDSRFVGT